MELKKIIQIHAEIFQLAKKSPDLETMHWYMWLDDCFENDEFDKNEFENLRWRIWVLKEKGELVTLLAHMINPILEKRKLIDSEGKCLKK